MQFDEEDFENPWHQMQSKIMKLSFKIWFWLNTNHYQDILLLQRMLFENCSEKRNLIKKSKNMMC